MLRRSILISGISGLAAFSGLALAQSMSSTSAEKLCPTAKGLKLKIHSRRLQSPRTQPGLGRAVLDQATYQPKIERLMTPKRTKPGTKDTRKDWEKYRNIFLGAHRLNLGVQFWKDNETSLERAREIYHVDPAVIIGIIGVETRYGENTGNWKVLDSLVTLSFDYKRRADFFKKELEEFLVILYKMTLSLLMYKVLMLVPSVCRSSCQALSNDSAWILTVTEKSTSIIPPLTRSALLPTI